MNWLNLAAMNGQQAPPRACTPTQASRSDPLHTASMSRKRTVGQISATIRAALNTVRMTLLALPNRCSRTHSGVPAAARGGSLAGISSRRTKVFAAVPGVSMAAVSAIDQPQAGVVPVHQQARDQG